MKKESLKEQIIDKLGKDVFKEQMKLTEPLTIKDCHSILNEIAKKN